MNIFSPAPLNKRELVSMGDVFSPVLEIRNAGSPVDIFTPVPLNKRELVSMGDCIPQLLKIRRVGTSGENFYPTLKFIVASY